MPKLQIADRAISDILEVGAFTRDRWGAARASRYLTDLNDVFELLAARPMIGKNSKAIAPNLRRFNHASHIIFYKLLPVGIVVMRVLHKSRALRRQDFT